MMLDNLLAFSPLGQAFSLVAGAGVAVPSPNVIDILGAGVGQAPPGIIGNRTIFGEDSGVGGIRPQLEVIVGTAFVTANAATVNCAMQAAPDTGLAGGYLPGTWQTLVETGAITAAQLTASAIFGRFDWPPAFPVGSVYRFLRLLFSMPAGANFSAGTVMTSIAMVRDDYSQKYSPRNYNV